MTAPWPDASRPGRKGKDNGMDHSSTPTYGTVPDGATVLAEQAGYQYLAVAWVYRRRPGGQIEYYSTVEFWGDTPAAQLAKKDAEISTLQARIAELEQRLRAAPPTAPPSDQDLEVCGIDGCLVEKPSGRSIQMHRTRVHHWQRPPGEEEEDGELVELGKLPDRPDGWRCAECLSSAFTPSLHDETR